VNNVTLGQKCPWCGKVVRVVARNDEQYPAIKTLCELFEHHVDHCKEAKEHKDVPVPEWRQHDWE